MKRVFFIFGVIVSLIATASATTINLSADKTEIQLGDEIKFHLEIYPSKPIGGKLSVYNEVSHNKFHLARVLFSKPSPSQCTACVGDFPLSEDLERNFYFQPNVKGTYYAEANFGGVRDKVNFTVFEPTTTTTTTTSTTTTSSSTTSTTTTTMTPTSTTTTSLTTTTTIEKETVSCGSCALSSWITILLIVIIILLISIKFIRRS